MSTVCERLSPVDVPREPTREDLAAAYYGAELLPSPPHDHFERVHDPELGREKQIEAVREMMGGQPQTVRQALRLVQCRFGCFYKGLDPVFQADPAVIETAAIASHGTELAFAPPEALERLGVPFFKRLLEQGSIPGWAVEKFAPKSVVGDPAIRGILEQMEQTRLATLAQFTAATA